MTVLLALFGFAPTESQERIPPILAYAVLGVGAYYTGWVLDLAAWMVGPTLSPYLRIPGILCVAFVAHGAYRAVMHRDGLSWAGWVRSRIAS